MTTPNEITPVGGDEPRKPTHSLPRYSEPTPETRRKLSREEEAELALKNTVYSAGSRGLLIVLFLLTILFVPAIQLACEMRAPRAEGRLGTFNLYKAYPAWEKIRAARTIRDVWRLLPRAAELKAVEKELETDSVVSEWLLPRVQGLLSEKLGAGNEQVYLGRDHWLFYRPDVDYVTGPPFLDPAVATHRAQAGKIEADPVKAITDFRDQLAQRGIDLIAMPIPMKPGVEGEKLAAWAMANDVLQNSSFLEFRSRLEKNGIRVFDATPLLVQRKSAHPGQPLYLESDTHWRPETMEFVAENLAAFIKSGQPGPGHALGAEEVTGVGDIARMLKLPEAQKVFRSQAVAIHPVKTGDSPWRPSKDADTLLLGDSFSNIFSLDALGWGESAGLAEHLSRALGDQPLDCILRNSDGAFATREILSRELARGHDRLAGKKRVIWEFAARELAFGNWKMLPMKLGPVVPAKFFAPKTGTTVTVTGIAEAVSLVPQPGSVPYKDHILSLHLTDLAIEGQEEATPGLEALVYAESMRDNVLTPAARVRPGDRVTFRLRSWSDVSDKYEKINRSEIDDPAIQLEEPVWGELAK